MAGSAKTFQEASATMSSGGRTASSAQAEIDLIDRLIDANRREVFRRLRFAPSLSASEWQIAWDRCPDLRRRDHELFAQRGGAQEVRDKAIHHEWQAQQRRERAVHRKAMKAKLHAAAAKRSLLCQCGLPILPHMETCEFHSAAGAA